MLTKEEYILSRIEALIKHYLKEGKNINHSSLLELITQWSFDYEMEKNAGKEV